jgi:hypothetical protein
MAVQKSPFLSQAAWDYLLRFTQSMEVIVLYMYNNRVNLKDANDVTCGIGFSLPDQFTAERLYKDLFYSGTPTTPATGQQLRDDWNAAASLLRTYWTPTGGPGNLGSTPDGRGYADVCKLRMNRDKVIDKMAEILKSKIEVEVKTHLTAALFAKFPAQAQVACASYFYGWNLSKAPKLKQSLLQMDFDGAARNCEIHGWAKPKNAAHKRLFQNAAAIANTRSPSDSDFDELPKSTNPPEAVVTRAVTV